MLSLLKTEKKPLDFTDRVKKWGGEERGKKRLLQHCHTVKKKEIILQYLILDSSILPSNHMKLQEENIKAKKKKKKGSYPSVFKNLE